MQEPDTSINIFLFDEALSFKIEASVYSQRCRLNGANRKHVKNERKRQKKDVYISDVGE